MSVAVGPPVNVPRIQTSDLVDNSSGKPPPPPPKSPLRTTSRSGSVGGGMTRRRSDGKLVTLNIPTPLSALDPSTPPIAEPVPTRPTTRAVAAGRVGPPPASPTSAMHPGATLAAMRHQTERLRPRYYARPASPLRLQSAKRIAKRESSSLKREGPRIQRESSLGSIGRRLSSSAGVVKRRASAVSVRKSFRRSKSNASLGQGISNEDVNATGNGNMQGQVLKRRQSLVDLARRESGKLKSILKSGSTSRTPQAATPAMPVPAPVTTPAADAPMESESRTESEPGTASAPVAPKKVGASWHPPRRDLERRLSASKLGNILKPNPKLTTNHTAGAAPANATKPPVPASLTKPEMKRKAPAAITGPSQRSEENPTLVVEQDKATFDIVAPVSTTQVQEQEQPATQSRDIKDILSEIETKHLSAVDARRLIRQHNREYFHSRIWDPALQSDFVGAYKLAHEGDEPPGTNKQQIAEHPKMHPDAQAQVESQVPKAKQDSGQKLVGPAPPDKDLWRRFESAAEADDWGRSVRLAMAKLENKITTEATADPAKFMKARRESAQLRAWIAAQRRTSEARMSAIAMGRMRPESPFEQAFVAELLRENEIKFKHSSNPMVEAEKLFRDYREKKNSLLPHYVPFSQYPLLTPLEEIQAEAKHEETEMPSDERPSPRRRLSVFDEKKTARRAGREYKSLSTSSQLDQLEMHEARCCGLWKPKAFVDKIS